MSYELRALSVGELLDRSFGLYRRHFLLFVGIMAVPSVAMLVISIAMQLVQPPAAEGSAPQDPAMLIGAFAAGAVLFAAVLLVYWISYAVALGATTVAVADIYRGGSPTVAETYRAIRSRTGRLAWLLVQLFLRLFGVFTGFVALGVGAGTAATLVVGPAAIVAGMLLMMSGMLVCFWMVLRYGVSVAPAVLEDATASQAIRRSIELTRGHLWRVLVLVIFAAIVSYAALGILQFPFLVAAFTVGPETTTGFWLNMAGVVAGSIAAAFTSPLAVIAMAVLYYDLRVRKEGLDIELMIASLGAEAPASAPVAG